MQKNKQSCLVHFAAKQMLPLWTVHQCFLSQQQDVYKVNEHKKIDAIRHTDKSNKQDSKWLWIWIKV